MVNEDALQKSSIKNSDESQKREQVPSNLNENAEFS